MSLTTSTDNTEVTQESIKVCQERARMDLVQGGFKGYPVNISSEVMGFIEHQVSTPLQALVVSPLGLPSQDRCSVILEVNSIKS